jgi:C4-dicarboxylate-specific signal transduction histidine kinase
MAQVKQPLTAIVANAGAGLAIVQQAPQDSREAAELFHLIEQDGHRAAALVGIIRAMFAHRSSEKSRLDINQLIRETTTLVAGELMVGQVRLALAFDERTPPLIIDRVQMKHVFLNLVANAIEAMSSVTDRPRVLAIRTTTSDAGVQISVQDSGSGIDAGNLDRIFDPFFTTKSQGTGMGLSLSRSIVEGHGGCIWATTDQPFGTTYKRSHGNVFAPTVEN